MKRNIVSVIAMFAAAVLSPAAVLAATSVQTSQTCQPVYGGSQTCQPGQNVVINKTVQNPKNGQFVDNLTANDPKYLASNAIAFHITLTNTGSQTVPQITVKDMLPEHVNFVSGPGTFDTNARTLTYTVSNLGAGQTQTTTVFTQAADMSQFAQDVTCVTNQAVMTIGSETAQDNAGLCIERQPSPTATPVLGTNTPSTTPGVTTTNPGNTSTGTTQPGVTTEGGQPTTSGQTAGAPGTIPSTTKGGQKVFAAPLVQNTPKTGSEDLISLLALIPTGTIGYIIRRKSLLK